MNSVDSKKSRNTLILSILGGIVLCVITFFCGRCGNKTVVDEEIVYHDTTYITHIDTVKVDSIIYKTKIKLDTLYVHDTLLIREQKEYEDSLSHIWISGIDAEIDSILYTMPEKETIIETEIIRTIHKKSGWTITIGPYIGVGAALNNNKVYLSPEIGVGVTIGYGWMIEKKKK